MRDDDHPGHGRIGHALAATGLCTSFITVAACLSWWTGEALLAPSLGAAVLTQVATPTAPNARIWPIAVGQLCGVAGGFLGVHLAGAASTPAFTAGHALLAPRIGAIAIALSTTTLAMFATRALSPVGGATALVVALGTETATLSGLARLVGAIALVTTMGELCRLAILHRRRLRG